jgi:hypothetical protein
MLDDWQSWQLLVVSATLAVSLTVMVVGVWRVLYTKTTIRAVRREGTALESGIVAAIPAEDEFAIDAFSYRVAARFAGRVRIVVYPDRVAVAGPRAPKLAYRLWIWVQSLLLALVPPIAAAALVRLDWRWLIAALATFAASWLTSIIGAGLWPGLGEVEVMDHARFTALEFDLDDVADVTQGAGWSNGGMAIVLWPYKKGIDGMAGDRAVSFFAPDEDGNRVRYALHAYSGEDAADLAAALR